MVKNILLINVGVFVIQSLLRLPFSEWLGLRVVFSSEFMPHQFLTYMWVHGGGWHLFGNMLAVFFFGPILEQVWGPKRFLIFYLACGIGAGVLFGAADLVEKYQLKKDTEVYLNEPDPERFSVFIMDHRINRSHTAEMVEFADEYYENPTDVGYISQSKEIVKQIFQFFSNTPMVGASGAVFGILMAFAMLFPNMPIYLYFLFPVKAKYLVFAYALMEIYSEINRSPGDNVAHLAHLGGMVIAFVIIKIWERNRNINRFY